MSKLTFFRFSQTLLLLLILIPFSQEYNYLNLVRNYRLNFQNNSPFLSNSQTKKQSQVIFHKKLPKSPIFAWDYDCNIKHGNVRYWSEGKLSCSIGEHYITNFAITDESISTNNVEIHLNGQSIQINIHKLTISHPTPIYVDGHGSVTFNLEGTNTIYGTTASGNGNPAINCADSRLTIIIKGNTDDPSNQLLVKSVKSNPAIGSNSGCQKIKIESGYIEATATVGDYYDNDNQDADGKKNYQASGAGIGTGTYGSVTEIEITGGTVIATGGQYGAGIGTGNCGFVQKITLSGGTITATGGEFAAGIGAGYGGRDESQDKTWSAAHVDTITIKDSAKVFAYSTKGRCEGAAIGGGYGRGYYSAYVKDIYISGGEVYAKVNDNGHGAAIGGGNGKNDYSSTVKNIEITGGTVTAIGSYDASGIGYGRGEYNQNDHKSAGSVNYLKITCGVILYASSRLIFRN